MGRKHQHLARLLRQLDSPTNAGREFARDLPVGEITILRDFEGPQHGQVQPPAAHHGKGGGAVKEGPAGQAAEI